MIRLALRSLRFRLGGAIATLLAVAGGTALVLSAGALLETGIRLDAPPQRFAGAPIVVTGGTDFQFPDGSGSAGYAERSIVDAGLAARLRDVAGVARAVPDVSFPAVVLRDGAPLATGDEVLAGHAWESAALTPYALTGAPPAAPTDVVVDARTARAAGVRPGGTIAVAVDGRSGTYRVTGIARPARAVAAPALFFANARGHAAQAIGVLLTPGADRTSVAARIARRLPAGLHVRTGDDRGRGEFAAVSPARLRLIIVAGVFGGLVLVVMGIVVAAGVTLSVRQRQRELALLRAGGATPFQVRRLVIDEVLIVAVVGAGLGVAGGWLLARPLFDQLVTHAIVPAGVRFAGGVLPAVAAALVALLAARVAAGFAARPAARVSPVQALQEAAIPTVTVAPIRRVLAAAFAVGTFGLAVTTVFLSPNDAAALGGPAELTGAIAVALVAPALVRAVAARARGWRRRGGVTGRLATVNLEVRAAQFGTVLTPIVLATSIAVGNVYSQTSQDAAARAAYLDPLRADVVVQSSVGGIAPALADHLAAVPGVRGASELVASQGWLERPFDNSHTSDPWPLLGLSAQGSARTYTAPVRAGSLRDLHGAAVALPAGTAGAHVGERVRLRFGDGGTADLRVVALVGQRSGYEQILLPARLLAAHVTAGLTDDVLLRTDGAGRDAIERVVAGWPGVTVGGRDALRAEVDAGLDMQAWINYLVAALAIAYAALATINSLAVSILGRRREFGLQALTGSTRRQVATMLCLEGGAVAALGLAVGTAVAAFTVLPITFATGEVLPSGPVWVIAAIVASVILLVLPVTLLAARVALRPRPVEAIADARE